MSSNLFNPTSIRELRVLDENDEAGLVNSLIDMFTQTAEPSATQMLAAARANEADKLAALAHTLRATSGNLGAVACASLCEELEQMAMYQKSKVATAGVALSRRLLELVPATIAILAKERL